MEGPDDHSNKSELHTQYSRTRSSRLPATYRSGDPLLKQLESLRQSVPDVVTTTLEDIIVILASSGLPGPAMVLPEGRERIGQGGQFVVDKQVVV